MVYQQNYHNFKYYPLSCILFEKYILNKSRTMDSVQNCDNYKNRLTCLHIYNGYDILQT
jgi:hypothetical protein